MAPLEDKLRQESVLALCGYRVGKKFSDQQKRRDVLYKALHQNLTGMVDAAESSAWRLPGSEERHARISSNLNMNVQRFSSQKSHEEAVSHYLDDWVWFNSLKPV